MQTITVNLRKQLFIASSKDVLNLVAQYVLCSPASRICGETRSTEGNNKKIVGTERSSDDAGTSGWMPQNDIIRQCTFQVLAAGNRKGLATDG